MAVAKKVAAKPAAKPAALIEAVQEEQTEAVALDQVAESEVGGEEEGDMLLSINESVQSLTESEAIQTAVSLKETIEENYFTMGGVMARINAEGWYMNAGYETFAGYAQEVLGCKYRKAMYLIEIYTGLVGSGVPWSAVKDLGWTKMKELASILAPDNVDAWVEAAKAMTVLQLKQYISEQLKGSQAGSAPAAGTPTPGTSTITFKVHPDQKESINEAINAAKHAIGTDVATVALESICVNYLSGATGALKTPSLPDMIAKLSMEEVLQAVADAYPDYEVQVTAVAAA